jgi:hypothetical protein
MKIKVQGKVWYMSKEVLLDRLLVLAVAIVAAVVLFSPLIKVEPEHVSIASFMLEMIRK